MLGTLRSRAAAMCVIAGVVLIGLGVAGPSVRAANNPLNGWTQQGGDAAWQVQPAGDSVKVEAPTPNNDDTNGPISFFVSPANRAGTFKVTMSAETQADEGDYIGFALGYQAPVNNEACTSAAQCSTNFYLFDWKHSTEVVGSTPEPPANGGQEGFSLMRVRGNRDLQHNNTANRPACFWTHQQANDACDVLDTDYGSTLGYDYGVTYTFEVTYTAQQLRVVLLGSAGAPNRTIFDQAPPSGEQFPVGRLAFYNYSQPVVTYSFDDGTVQNTTTSTTAATTTTTAAAATTTRPTVGPVTRSTLVRTGPTTAAGLQLAGGVALLALGAVLTASRGKRPEGRFYA